MAAKTAHERNIDRICREAKEAAHILSEFPNAKIKTALLSMAKLLDTDKNELCKANARDCEAARRKGLSSHKIDRLTLSDKTFASMKDGLKVVANLDSPVGQIYDERRHTQGMRIYKRKVPVGVVGIIYESRPNVTVDAAAICLKSKNAVILRGGSEAFETNTALAKLFSRALDTAGLPAEAVRLVETTRREAVNYLLTRDDSIDLIIPRGGENLIRTVVTNSSIPVIKHYKGVCHIYVAKSAGLRHTIPIVVNAKTQRPSVCNAMETLLLDSALDEKKKRRILDALLDNGVTLYGDTSTRALDRRIKKAGAADWYEEYLDLRCTVKQVDGCNEAIAHINTYGSRHTDAILTRSKKEMEMFRRRVDSSSVMINASTRFSDGGEYGMGCEIGISTDKLHARGPMGVQDLTTYKWIVEGEGQIRQ